MIVDGTCTPDQWWSGYQDWIEGGFTACVLSVGGGSAPASAVAALGAVHRRLRETDRLQLVLTAAEMRHAAAQRRLAVLLHFQTTHLLGDNPDLVEVYWRLGVRMFGLAYNRTSPVAGGALDPVDEGLSAVGRRMIAEMNRLGILVDFAHTGWRSCAQALELSSGPCVASHSNAHAVHAHPRNLPDSVIKGIAASGGIVGMNGFPAFVSSDSAPTLDQFIDHMVHIDSLVGPGHVGLGLDYCTITSAEYEEMIDSGDWTADDYPPPPWNYPQGIENPRSIDALARRMSVRGYADQEINGILGANWMRVFELAFP
ncbi:dipeptidase [Dactylosporangium sp. NPDC000521]|uniref:dipeptidase n=1 Tax=Dactylosporangium sp. NPDC000521 TaxID=3363975 RepID=UPI0036883855